MSLNEPAEVMILKSMWSSSGTVEDEGSYVCFSNTLVTT